MPENDQRIVEWETVLDRLELELQQAAPLASGRTIDMSTEWVAPAGLPPLPHQLADRVRAILDEQAALLVRLETTRRNTRKHLQYLDANAAKGLGGGPLFIDEHS